MTEQLRKDYEKNRKIENNIKEKKYQTQIGGDWVWPNDTNMRAEDILSAHESIQCGEISFAHKGIANTSSFLVTFS